MRRIHRRVHLNVLYVTVRSVRLDDHEPPGDHMGSKSNNSHTRPIADPFGVQWGSHYSDKISAGIEFDDQHCASR
jgi:hypothetical protein